MPTSVGSWPDKVRFYGESAACCDRLAEFAVSELSNPDEKSSVSTFEQAKLVGITQPSRNMTNFQRTTSSSQPS
jgi:hypothetical protein